MARLGQALHGYIDREPVRTVLRRCIDTKPLNMRIEEDTSLLEMRLLERRIDQIDGSYRPTAHSHQKSTLFRHFSRNRLSWRFTWLDSAAGKEVTSLRLHNGYSTIRARKQRIGARSNYDRRVVRGVAKPTNTAPVTHVLLAVEMQ
jgi:hypothetical protein